MTSNSLFWGDFGLCPQVDDTAKSIQKAQVKADLLKASTCLAEKLKAAGYNGCYFDRTGKEPDRLCTREGWFTCQVREEYKHTSLPDPDEHTINMNMWANSQMI